MKVGIVGAGLVGSTAAYALLMQGVGREIVLVDRAAERAAAEADDLFHAVPFAHPLEVCAGSYDDLEGAAAVVIAAGVSQRPGESRHDLLGRNAEVFSAVVPAVLKAAPQAVLVIATNPVDVMTHVASRFAEKTGGDASRVLGTGTTLDTARFRSLVARSVGVDAQHVHAYVLGEHGDTEVLAWSSATVAGMPMEQFCLSRGTRVTDEDAASIDERVRNAAYRIIAGKGATYYGVGSAIARIVDTVLSDRRSVLTVTHANANVVDVEGTCISLPRLVGGSGVMDTFVPSLSRAELDALVRSAAAVRDAIDEVGAI